METTTCPLKAIGKHIVVTRRNPETRSRGGIIIPDGAAEKPMMGVVHEIGPGAFRPFGQQVNPGDEVVFGKYSGLTVSVEGTDYLIVKDEDVVAVLRPQSVTA